MLYNRHDKMKGAEQMKIANEIRKLCIDNNITLGTLADRTHQTRQNLSNKMTKDNFTIRQLEDIAKALDCDIKIEFIPCASSKDDNEVKGDI